MIEISFKLYNTEEDRNIIIIDKNNNHYIAYKYMENDMIVESRSTEKSKGYMSNGQRSIKHYHNK